MPAQGRAIRGATRARRSAPVRRIRARVCARRCKKGRFAVMRPSLSGIFDDFHFSEGGVGEFPRVFLRFRKVGARNARRVQRAGVQGLFTTKTRRTTRGHEGGALIQTRPPRGCERNRMVREWSMLSQREKSDRRGSGLGTVLLLNDLLSTVPAFRGGACCTILREHIHCGRWRSEGVKPRPRHRSRPR